MTTDYSKLDTAALAQAAETLTAEITPGSWEQGYKNEAGHSIDQWRLVANPGDRLIVASFAGIDDADAAFIAAAPALVRALVARLREAEGHMPPPAKFKVNDKVRVGKPVFISSIDRPFWPEGQVFTVKSLRFMNGVWEVETSSRKWKSAFLESELERVENG